MKEFVISFFRTDTKYKTDVEHYNVVDGILALLICIIDYIILYYMGYLYKTKKIYKPIVTFCVICAIISFTIFLRKQKLKSIGISKYRLKDSLICGGIVGSILCILLVLFTGVLAGRNFYSLPIIIYDIFFYFIIIAFEEELLFRAFIQTRLHGIVRNECCVSIITGILFSVSHIPFQMALHNMNTIDFITYDFPHLIMCFLMHIVFNFFYKKYNSIVTGTLIHGFMDFAQNIYRY